MISSVWEYPLFLLPNLGVGLAYLVLLKGTMKTRLVAALPSAVFVLIPALGLCLGLLEMRYEAAAKVVGPVMTLVYVAALALVALVLVRVRSWLNLTQIVNVFAGTMLWYAAELVLSGGVS